MPSITSVAIIGECMIELKKNAGSLEQSFGGDTLNTAVYLSRLTKEHGVSTSYVTGLGNDPFSSEMLNAWHDEGINTEMVYLSKDKLPGIYAIETATDGERSFYYWRNDSAAKHWLKDHAIDTLAENLCQHQMIYLSGISLAILADECKESMIRLLTQCRDQGLIIVFDNNYRPALWDNATQAQQWYKQMLAITDIAFLTFDDEQMLYGDDNEQQAIERTQALGVNEIVIKRGADACYVITPKGKEEVGALRIENVVDTTAAGDSFSAGYLAKRILKGTPEASAIAGHTLAGKVIQHRGAIIESQQMPTI